MTTMIRKSHKKSRNGCVQCKHRHIKCDESRPACGYCSITKHQCAYEEIPASPSQPSVCTSLPNSTNATVSIENDSDTSFSSRSTLNGDTGDRPVNMLHLELLRHLINKDLALFGYDKSKLGTLNMEIMDRIFTAPYLMNQILAFTSLHLSVICPTRKQEFQDHASRLRAHALTLFREPPKMDVKDCLTLFLFTSIRAVHIFTETITFGRKKFDDFLADFIEIFHLHQHVREITKHSWNLLLESPLNPILELEASVLMQQEPLMDFSELLALVDAASIDPDAKNTYMETIHHLQVAISGSQRQSVGNSTIGPIISWLVVVPPSYIDLLAKKRPEALAILAYFGALLHLHREIWMLGDSGLYVIDSISTYLDHTWNAWLQWPKNVQQTA